VLYFVTPLLIRYISKSVPTVQSKALLYIFIMLYIGNMLLTLSFWTSAKLMCSAVSKTKRATIKVNFGFKTSYLDYIKDFVIITLFLFWSSVVAT